VAFANSSDSPKQIFLCIVANDKKVNCIISEIKIVFSFEVNNDIT
jgi:hypothetical protein